MMMMCGIQKVSFLTDNKAAERPKSRENQSDKSFGKYKQG